MAKPQPGLDELVFGVAQLVGTVVFRAFARILASQETLDGGDVLGFVDREAAVLGVADDTLFIDQNAVRDGPEVEQRGG